MKRILLSAAIVAAAMTSCSKNEITTTIEDAPQAINFGTYVANTSTKADAVETVGAAKIEFVEGDKFGVFAYYTGATEYAEAAKSTEGAKPNFMYDQAVAKGAEVDGSITDWSYSPLKYWPNGVTSDNKPGMISFFSYWPMASDDNNLKLVTTAGADFAPTSTTDPCVEYTLVNGKNIDLMWAVDNADGEGKGLPFVDQTKQVSTGKMTFLFKHALARVGFQFQLADDITTEASEAATTVTINSIEFGGTLVEDDIEAALTPVLTPSALLNLNNETANIPNWIGHVTAADELTQLKLVTADFDNGGTFTEAGSSEAGSESAAFADGVVKNTAEDYLMIIPQDLEDKAIMRVTYTVSTVDDAYTAPVDVKNIFTFNLQDFVGGTAYLYDMTIGLNSVKVTAEIAEWPAEADSDVEIVIEDDVEVKPTTSTTPADGDASSVKRK